MSEVSVSAHAIAHVESLIEAAAQGGTLRRIKRADGSLYYYVKKELGPSKDFEKRFRKILWGEPGPGKSAPVWKVVVNEGDKLSAREHVDAQVPALFAVRP